jgi:murein DD-endopeptidase MepM/ murein hydrolase activator NlpD
LTGSFPDAWQKRAGGNTPPKHLVWPLQGRPLGRGFGSNNGQHLAVDVAAPIGTPVRVASSGIVGYAADGVRGYGKMVMVLHSGGWVTLYAHLSDYKARPGDWVKSGEVIALTGNTGLSRGPHLHFALIVRGKPVDPVPYMRHVPGRKKRLARLSTWETETAPQPWTASLPPPS